MEISTIKELIMPFIQEHDLELFDVLFVKEYGYKILRVMIDKDGGIDLDTLALANHYLSAKLDEFDQNMDEYMLEVCSPGAEKPLRTYEELQKHIDDYIHIKVEEMIYEGYLIGCENNTLDIKINIKGRLKVINVKYEEVKFARLAIKF